MEYVTPAAAAKSVDGTLTRIAGGELTAQVLGSAPRIAQLNSRIRSATSAVSHA